MILNYNPWSGVSRLPKQVWILFFANLINRVGMMARPFLVLYLTTKLGVTPAHAGLALTVFGSAAVLAGPLSGWMCDRVGALPVLWGSLAGSAALVTLLPWIHHFGGVLVCVAVWACVSEGVRPASLFLLTGATGPEQRRLALSVNRLANNLGSSVGPAVGGILAGISFVLLFSVDALTSFLGALLLFWWWGRHERVTVSSDLPPQMRSPLTALRDLRIFPLMLGSVLVIAVFMQMEGAWSMYVIKDLHYSPVFYGSMVTVNCLLIVTCEIPLIHATQRWSQRRVIAMACILVATGFGAMAFARTPLAIAATVVVWTFGEMLLFTLLPSLFEAYAPAGALGAYLGLYSASSNGAYAIGSWLGLAVLTSAGGRVLWSGCFLTGLLAMGILLKSFRACVRVPGS